MNIPHSRVALWLRLCAATLLVCALSTPSARAAEKVFGDPEEVTSGLLQEKLRGPLGDVDEVVFAVHSGTGWHWYETFGYVCQQPNRKKYARGGQLCRLNLRTGEVKVILDDPGGSVRDPCVHYSGERILISYRPGGDENYHLYEINPDGSGLRQLTSAPRDDIEPVYLPDGGIMFCSSRSNRWVPCFTTQVATLYRCDGEGSNIRQISSNVEHDNTPWVLPDGRVLYTRWEYVRRGVMSFHHLWTINPDGTGQMTYYGNMHPATLMIDAKPIPGSDRLVSIFSPWHGGPEHNGTVTVVNPDRGPITSLSYAYLRDRKFYREGPDGNVDPYSVLSGISPLPEHFTPKHHDVQASSEQRRLIKLWLDTGACFAGTYAAAGSGMVGAEEEDLWSPTPEPVLQAEIDVLSRRCDSCHLSGERPSPFKQKWSRDFPYRALHDRYSNLSHPEKSVVLRAPLAKEAGGLGLCTREETGEPANVFQSKSAPEYQKLLGALKASAEQLHTIKRYTMEGFVPNQHYVREMKRYGVLPESYEPGEDHIDVFEVDDRYFRSFWHRPEGSGGDTSVAQRGNGR